MNLTSTKISMFWLVFKLEIGHFRVSKPLTFTTGPSAQPFLWKRFLFAWEWKIISISKAEHLASFYCRGPRELGNGLLFWMNNKAINKFGFPRIYNNYSPKWRINIHPPLATNTEVNKEHVRENVWELLKLGLISGYARVGKHVRHYSVCIRI